LVVAVQTKPKGLINQTSTREAQTRKTP